MVPTPCVQLFKWAGRGSDFRSRACANVGHPMLAPLFGRRIGLPRNSALVVDYAQRVVVPIHGGTYAGN